MPTDAPITTTPRRGYSALVGCPLAGLLAGATLLRIGRWLLGGGRTTPPGLLPLAWLVLAASVLYGLWWSRRPPTRPAHHPVLAFWQGLICADIALDLSLFGWQKIAKLQFFTPLGMLDLPFSSFSGEDLTWAFFGYSYPYRVAIGLLQILGAWLLLFGRTRLLGTLVLVPILLNIVLLDYFYHLPVGVLCHALIILAGVLYLLLLDYERLVEFFWRAPGRLPRPAFPGRRLRLLGRLAIMSLPLLLLSVYHFPDTYPQLTGKYTVRDLRLDGQPQAARTCQDSVLTTVYLDIAHDCVFEFNGPTRRLFGTYSYLAAPRRLSVRWRYPTPRPDSLQLVLTPTPAGLLAAGQLGQQRVAFRLVPAH
ncbi:hypothetical protein HHL22_17205 [Hymenobacter sp. RP-2-7]|uniref:Uncharacterized protein n=1 Tax=Hymenobacter polaris TaxID=2682546 RepID=A0A7Y0FNU2_9BACT|nr:hypothetical protein [Hymenobacter polaris]NML66946.1 hypothetical protein [Hymenobacter polaris]